MRRIPIIEADGSRRGGRTGKCIYCGLEFTEEDYRRAEEGAFGCLVGDYDNICYPCQFKYGTERARREMKR